MKARREQLLGNGLLEICPLQRIRKQQYKRCSKKHKHKGRNIFSAGNRHLATPSGYRYQATAASSVFFVTKCNLVNPFWDSLSNLFVRNGNYSHLDCDHCTWDHRWEGRAQITAARGFIQTMYSFSRLRNQTFMGSDLPFMVTGPRYSKWNCGSALLGRHRYLRIGTHSG
jgi:hypothetical protein